MNSCFVPANILLPDFGYVDGTRWATIACDQFTSQPEYWRSAEKLIGGARSTLNLFLPEAFLGEEAVRLPKISAAMNEYLTGVLKEHKITYIYVERVQSDGRLRRGIVGAVDLECYDWHRDAKTAVRATEETVPERIPPRVRIRKAASVELPHIMLLVDDPEKSLIEPLAAIKDSLRPAYDFDLMLGGGHISGWFVDGDPAADIMRTVDKIGEKSALTLAVGDGNHSLATAKAVYEELKSKLGDAALTHPARFALAEVVNIHDEALDFEPIYRIVNGVSPEKLCDDFKKYAGSLKGIAKKQEILLVSSKKEMTVTVEAPTHQLPVGTVQNFLNDYIKENPDIEVDYIHGEENVKALAAKRDDCTGFIFEGMTKNGLFRSVECDGSLPRKTFSMGHAEDKRYYVEARKIVI